MGAASGFKQEINIKVPKASISLFGQQGAQEIVSFVSDLV